VFKKEFVGFQVLTAASMNMTVFCDVAPCSLVEIDRLFIAPMMEAVSTSETSVKFYLFATSVAA
jgi:hypothetical protein